MKTLFTFLVIACCLLTACKTPSPAKPDNNIILGTVDSIKSGILHETRKIWVYLPDSYKTNTSTSQRFPVVYLLDGEAHFYSVVGMIQQLSSVNGNSICPEMIVVGIPNTDRTRDLTPTHVASDPPFLDSNFARTSGGGEQFISFIEKELMPHINSVYPANPYKLLIGHSFGGLTVINTLVHHPKLFNAYVAIDPSMWWDNKKLLKEVEANLSSNDLSHTSLFLGIANTMEPGMDTTRVQGDTTSDSRHIRSILELGHYLSAEKKSGLSFAYKYYNGDNHGSVPLITEYDALHFLFNYYAFSLTGKEYSNITKAVIGKIESHYDTVSAHIGFKVYPPENYVNQLAYQASGTKHHSEAEYLALLNTTNYPTSANAFDTLGDIYNAEGNKEKAMESYKKALTITDLPDTRKKLEKLQGK
jgi:predicted alpha/beta superfamily hydrolase